MNEGDKKSCGSFNQEQNVDYNAETDCINEDNSWFFNFTLETEPSLPVKEVRKPVLVDISDRRPSQRTEKLTRSTAGKQTHLRPQIISGNRGHGKSALTLYLEDKNALYDSYRAKYLSRIAPSPPEPEDPQIKKHWEDIEAVKIAIRVRWNAVK
jgi:hypothetical protein